VASVELRGLTKRYGDQAVVDDVSLRIDHGLLVCLLGPSGCGKTTTLRLIAGFVEPSAGEIAVGDRLVSSPSRTLPPEKRNMSMIFQSYALWPHMTVTENVAYGLTLRKIDKATIAQKVRAILGVTKLEALAGRYPGELSGGQQQRVALARALIVEPETLLLDEPLSNLDANLRVAMRTEIKALHLRLKTTSIYVTHDQIEAMTMADKIVVMNAGRIEQIGTPLELYDNPVNQFVAGFIGSPAMNFLTGRMAMNGMGLAVAVGNGIHLPMPLRAAVDEGREVIVGVRPEHFAVDDTGVPAEVVVVEPTGADTQIFCKLAGVDVTAVVRERHDFLPGAAVRLKPSFTFLFDPASGARLA